MAAYDGLMGVAPMDGIVTYHYLVFRLTSGISLDFIKILLTSDLYKQDFSVRVRGLGESSQGQVRTPHIRISDMLQTVMPLPTFAQQGVIADCIGRENQRMRLLASFLRKQIDLLRENRQALITAAVTGELDVSGVAA
jgi:type I restriction enzyme S subunit